MIGIKLRTILRLFTVVLLTIIVSCQSNPKAKLANAERIVLNPRSSEAESIDAFSRLRKPGHNISIEFWRQIIDDDQFSPLCRNRALLLLLIQHLKPGMSLGQASTLFSGSPWTLRRGVTEVLDFMTGPPPFVQVEGTITVAIQPSLPPDDPRPITFFLEVEGPYLTTSQFLDAITHPSNSKFSERKIITWGAVTNDPRDECLLLGAPIGPSPIEKKRNLLDIELDTSDP